MMFKISLHTARRVLAAGLVLGAAAVQAAGGVSVTRYQETAITVGMSAAQVQQILGRPAQVFRYSGAPGPSWNYYVAEGKYGNIQFGVDFGSDGTVVSAREFAVQNSG